MPQSQIFVLTGHLWHVAKSNVCSAFVSFSFGEGVTELDELSNGKASILKEPTRLLKDLLSQIESLKKDSASLFSQTHYVSSWHAFTSFLPCREWRLVTCLRITMVSINLYTTHNWVLLIKIIVNRKINSMPHQN